MAGHRDSKNDATKSHKETKKEKKHKHSIKRAGRKAIKGR